MLPAVVRGALLAVVLAFPLAAICALVYRFPVPFAGYAAGPGEVLSALFAVVFYGLVGGFPALAAAGAVGGAMAYGLGKPDIQRVRRLALAFSAVLAALAVGTLAILEKLIGPW